MSELQNINPSLRDSHNVFIIIYPSECPNATINSWAKCSCQEGISVPLESSAVHLIHACQRLFTDSTHKHKHCWQLVNKGSKIKSRTFPTNRKKQEDDSQVGPIP